MSLSLILLYICISAVGMYAGVSLFSYFRILDRPGPDVPERPPVPTMQGAIVVVLFFLLLGVSKYVLDISFGREFLGLFLGGAVIGVVSIVDELGRIVHKRFRISAGIRFVIQILVASAAWRWSGLGVDVISVGLVEMIGLTPFLSRGLTVARFLLFINAINWFDGVYGLASGVSSIGFLTIALLICLVVFTAFPYMSLDRSELLTKIEIVSVILCILSLVATIVEYKPRGLMRDVGTMFFGFCLAYLSLLGGAKIGTLIAVLSLPVLDALWVVINRIKNHKNPAKGDHTHLHYRLLALGRNRHEVRIFVRGWTGVMMVLMLLQGSDGRSKLIIFIVFASVFVGVNVYLFRIKKLPSEYRGGELEIE